MGHIKTIHIAICDYCGRRVELEPESQGETFNETVLNKALAGYLFSSAYCCEPCLEEALDKTESLPSCHREDDNLDAARDWLEDTNNRPALFPNLPIL